METLALGPVFMGVFLDPGGWEREFTNMMDGYQNLAGMWILEEDMPQSDNRITLSKTATDQYRLPAPNVHFDEHPNDLAMREYAFQKAEAYMSLWERFKPTEHLRIHQLIILELTE